MMGAAEESAPSPLGSIPRFGMRAPQEALTPGDFEYGKVLGLGSYSKVVKVKRKDTDQIFALKVMDKRHIIRENKVKFVKMERMILDQLDFPGVIRLCFTFQDVYSLYMGLECCTGGELFDQIRRKGRMPEKEARFYAAEVVDILEYIHSQGVIHRDLKPENILITAEGHLKLCDFGSAKMVRPLSNGYFQPEDGGENSCPFVGTAEYVSPEVLTSNPVQYAVDLWALGCIVYQMLEGRPPFKEGTEYLTFQKVMARQFVMPSHFSPEARDLVDRLLDLKPDQRLGAQGYDKLKSHPFFKGIDWSILRRLPSPKLVIPPEGSNAGDSDGSPGQSWESTIVQAYSTLAVGRSSSESSMSGGSLSAGSKLGSPINRVQSPASPTSSDSSIGRSPTHDEPNLWQSETGPVAMSSPSHGLTDGHGSSGTLTDGCCLEHWQRFIQPGGTLVANAMVKKHKSPMTKKLQLLLIDKPRLLLVDPLKLTIVVEVPWSPEMKVKVENAYKFKVTSPNQTFSLEDLRGQAWLWKDAIEDLQRRFPSYSSSKTGGEFAS